MNDAAPVVVMAPEKRPPSIWGDRERAEVGASHRTPQGGVPLEFVRDEGPKTNVDGQTLAEIEAIREDRTPAQSFHSLYAKTDDHGKRISQLEIAVAGVGGDVRGLGGTVHGLGGKVDTLSMFVGTLNATLAQKQQVETTQQQEAAKVPNLQRERWNTVLKVVGGIVLLIGGWLAHKYGGG